MPAELIPRKLFVVLGRTIMSIPMPFWRALKPLILPSRIAVIERIMITSIAIANALMRERRGRWTRLPRTSLFILIPVYGSAAFYELTPSEGRTRERRGTLRTAAVRRSLTCSGPLIKEPKIGITYAAERAATTNPKVT